MPSGNIPDINQRLSTPATALQFMTSRKASDTLPHSQRRGPSEPFKFHRLFRRISKSSTYPINFQTRTRTKANPDSKLRSRCETLSELVKLQPIPPLSNRSKPHQSGTRPERRQSRTFHHHQHRHSTSTLPTTSDPQTSLLSLSPSQLQP